MLDFAQPEAQLGAVQSTPLRVLVVDDSKLQRKIVALNLKKWGFHVTEAGTGREALEICQSQDVDMVLSDWMMPEMDGLEFCKAFRALDRKHYGYFILLTSKSGGDEVAEGLDVGADDFLSKPVNTAELEARIRAGTRVLDMETKLVAQNDRVNQALSELQDLYDEINKDLAEAEKLQQSLIPVRHRVFDQNEVSLLFQSSSHVGGDLVGFFSLEPNRLCTFSIDVSGHGISSALLTARLAGYFSPHSKEQNISYERASDGSYQRRNPADVATALNARMMEDIETEHYFTIALADIDLTTGHTHLVQAGHPHPMIFNPETGVRFTGDGGPPIGLIPDIPFSGYEVTLKPGDNLLLYSDGVTECQDSSGELLDDEGLEEIATSHIHESGQAFLDSLMEDLTAFAEGEVFGDDVSAILFQFNAPVSD